jgi:hypothetical protein
LFHYTWHVTSSGSKAEGLNLPGSDFDVMFINKHIHVYELHDVLSNYHDLRTKFNLVLDTFSDPTTSHMYVYNLTETSSITVKKKIYT